MRTIKFHQGFKMDRERLATLIRCLHENETTSKKDEGLSKKDAATYMGVGLPAAEGCIGWLLKVGLGKVQPKGKGYALTPLGSLVAANDPELNNPGTLWLLHYYLASDHEERSEVWYQAFNEFFNVGTPFTRDALQIYIERSLDATPTNKSGVADDCKEFMKAYSSSIALGKLDLVREVQGNTFEASLNSAVEPYIFAFVLFDAWQRRFPHADTVRVSQICDEPELPGKVFAARRDQIVHMLQILQSMGLVNIVDSQHEPVTRRFRDGPYELLTKFYGSL